MDFDPRALEDGTGRRDETDTRDQAPAPRDARDRTEGDGNVNDVFVRALDLPRELDRHQLVEGPRTYQLRESQVRALAAVGAFRVVPAGELRDDRGAPMRLDRGDLRDLERAGLVKVVTPATHPHRPALVTLSSRGRALLEAHRRPDVRQHQTFYAGAARARELTHDAQIYCAYVKTAGQLQRDGGTILRVRLDHELKREYQRFLQEPNRGRHDSDGRPRRDADERRAWAESNELPYFDASVHFPDLRIEYERADGQFAVEDIEVRTPHYRGAHAMAKARAGFTPFDPDYAQEFV
jgi:hypothetical protein